VNEILCHLFGDYVLQNQWMANNKTKSHLAALVHVTLYTLPFLFLTSNIWSLAIISTTHFLIDRYRLVTHWTRFWGVGCTGYLPTALSHDVLPWEPEWESANSRWEYAPAYINFFCMVVVDNTFHLLINHFALFL
jgi:hypothetical protein